MCMCMCVCVCVCVCVYIYIYIYIYIYMCGCMCVCVLFKVQARYPVHTQTSDRLAVGLRLVGFAREREEGVVAITIPISSLKTVHG